MNTDAEALMPGTMLNGRYRIRRVLGAGGFGITYLAAEMSRGGPAGEVVIKECFPNWCAVRAPGGLDVMAQGDPRQYEWSLNRFMDEARRLSSLFHPCVIPVRDVFSEHRTAYYVMPYVRGGSLAQAAAWLGKEGLHLSQEAVLNLLRPLLGALAHMHERGICHRDVKPGNILLHSDGMKESPMLIDFGGDRMGSPEYMPQEQLNNERFGPWTDLYSLAAVFHKLLTGAPPPPHMEGGVVLAGAPRRLPLADRPELEAFFHPLLLAEFDRALEWEPERRFRSAEEWLKALDGVPPVPDAGGINLLRLMTNIRTDVDAAMEPEVLAAPEEQTGALDGAPADDRLKMVCSALFAGAAVLLLALWLLPAGEENETWEAPPSQEDGSEETYAPASEATPSGPSEATPSGPSEATPSGPSEATPSRPSEATPSRPSEATPSRPSEATPSRPSEATPSGPSEATPSRPSVATPSGPSEVKPSRTPEVKPSRTPEVKPSGPSEVKPSRAPEVKPSGPSEVKPSRAPEVKPSRTPEVKPSRTPEVKPSRAPEVKPSRAPEVKPSGPSEVKPSRTPEVKPSQTSKRTSSPAPGRGELLNAARSIRRGKDPEKYKRVMEELRRRGHAGDRACRQAYELLKGRDGE